MFTTRLAQESYEFSSLKDLLAKASPLRSADELAGVAASSRRERVAAQYVLADVPLKQFLEHPLIPYEDDDVTRLIVDTHDAKAFAPIASLSVGEFRDWLLAPETTPDVLKSVSRGVTPEMAAAVSKIMRAQDLILVSSKCRVEVQFRTTLGLPGHFSTRLQPNHPTDDPKGVMASLLDGLLLGSGDAVIGINPVTDSPQNTKYLIQLIDELRLRYAIPTQSCVLAHVTTTLDLIQQKTPVDLVFQSIAGSEKANDAFGFKLKHLKEAQEAALSLQRNPHGYVMYFETGQGSALSSNAHFDVDAQTMEARAYAVARHFRPFLVNTVVGFIGPEYLYNGKQITRAALEDHFCGKLMGLPMGCDVCYTNHADADQDDMDVLLTLLASSGCTYIMGVPGADDVMLNYQSTSFHDALYVRKLLKLRCAPEFEKWLEQMGILHPQTMELWRSSHPLLTAGTVS